MRAFFEITSALILILLIGIPVVSLFDKWKKEMDEDERGGDDVLE